MVCYVAHRCYCQLVRVLEGSYVVSCWKYDVCFSQGIAAGTEVVEVCARACVKTVWKLSQRVAVVAEVREVGRCVSVASVIVNEVEALQYVIESAQTI